MLVAFSLMASPMESGTLRPDQALIDECFLMYGSCKLHYYCGQDDLSSQ